MYIIATNRKQLIQALHRQGFFLVADLPRRTQLIEWRGLLIVRLP